MLTASRQGVKPPRRPPRHASPRFPRIVRPYPKLGVEFPDGRRATPVGPCRNPLSRTVANPTGSYDLRRWPSLTGAAIRGVWSGRSGSMSGEPTLNAGFELRVPVQPGMLPGPPIDRWRTRRGSHRRPFRRPATLAAQWTERARYVARTSSSDSGTTRSPPMEVMKFTSPFHRGTTWACRCDGRPAPAASP